MKFFVPLVCCLAFASAVPGGQSVSSRSQDDHGNYAFGYDIVDEHGAQNGRQEKGDANGNKVGSYMIKDIDGRTRLVEYVADAHGFRATIKTNEPGTETSAVGDATILSSAPIITEAKLVAAPAKIAYASAPIAYASAPIVKSAPIAYSAPIYAAPSAPILRSYAAPLAYAKSYAAPALYADDSYAKDW